MAKKKSTQLSLKFDKRGNNSVKASKIYQDAKKKWTKYFNAEVSIEKKKKKPDMPKAAKRAAKRYSKDKLTWAGALKKAGSTRKRRK